MPMQALVNAHIEADQQKPLCSELNCQVDGMKAAMPAPAYAAPRLKDKAARRPIAPDQTDAPLLLRVGPDILTDLQARKVLHSSVNTPPSHIAGIEHIGPRAELVARIDRDKPCPASRLFEWRVFGARPACNDDAGFTFPVRKPLWQALKTLPDKSC